jgi:hypothetical protein
VSLHEQVLTCDDDVSRRQIQLKQATVDVPMVKDSFEAPQERNGRWCGQGHRMNLDVRADVWVGLEGNQRDAVATSGKPPHQLSVVHVAAGAAIHPSR